MKNKKKKTLPRPIEIPLNAKIIGKWRERQDLKVKDLRRMLGYKLN